MQKWSKEAPRDAGFCPIARSFESIFQGCAIGRIITIKTVLEDICTAEGQQRCLFDALPAGRLDEDFFPETHKENIGSATGSQFSHHTSGSPTIRFLPLPPAPSGHLLRESVDPEHCLVHRAAPARVHHLLGSGRSCSSECWEAQRAGLEERAEARRMRLAAACLLLRCAFHCQICPA